VSSMKATLRLVRGIAAPTTKAEQWRGKEKAKSSSRVQQEQDGCGLSSSQLCSSRRQMEGIGPSWRRGRSSLVEKPVLYTGTGCRQLEFCCQLPVASCQLPVASCQLPVANGKKLIFGTGRHGGKKGWESRKRRTRERKQRRDVKLPMPLHSERDRHSCFNVVRAAA
jgi:hypothetical protein